MQRKQLSEWKGTHAKAGACQITFMEVENPEGSKPDTVAKAKSGEKVALGRSLR